MAQVLPNTTTTSNYKDTVLGMSGFYEAGSITIANNPVSIMLWKRNKDPGSLFSTEYTFVSPNAIPIVSGEKEWIVGLQIKSAIAGKPAQVFGWLQEPGTAGFAPGTPFTQTLNAGGTIGVGNFLGRFSQAQWPPQSPTDGDLAQLVDTNNSAAWLLAYTASTNLWTPYNGDTPGSGVFKVQSSSGASSGGTIALGSFIIGVAGTWNVDVVATSYQVANGTTVYESLLGTTAGANDILDKSGTNSAPSELSSLANALTFTKNETVFVTYKNSGVSLSVPAETVILFRPSSLANA